MKFPRSLAPALLACAALASSPSLAHAADTKPTLSSKGSSTTTATPAPTKGSNDEQAVKWISMGNKAFKDGKFADAEKAYREAFALKPVYDIAGNLAMAEFAQGNHRAAAEHLAFALRQFPITGEPAARQQMEKTFNQCAGHVGVVKVTVATARGAQVSVDGIAVGEAPLADALFLEPGKHTISVTAKGYKDASKDVEAKKGVTETVTLEMALLPPVVVVRNGTDAQPRSKKPAIVMGAVAVVAAAVGGALFAVSEGKATDARDQAAKIGDGHCRRPPSPANDAVCLTLIDTIESSDNLHNAAVGVFVGAGVVGAAAVVYLLLPPPAAKKALVHGLRATPIVGAGQAGFLLSGAF